MVGKKNITVVAGATETFVRPTASASPVLRASWSFGKYSGLSKFLRQRSPESSSEYTGGMRHEER